MLMTRAPTTAAADDHLLDAAARMAERNVRHLPIVDGDRHVVGILSDRDVRTAVGNSSRPLHPDDARVRMDALRVADAMTRDVFVVGQDARRLPTSCGLSRISGWARFRSSDERENA